MQQESEETVVVKLSELKYLYNKIYEYEKIIKKYREILGENQLNTESDCPNEIHR